MTTEEQAPVVVEQQEENITGKKRKHYTTIQRAIRKSIPKTAFHIFKNEYIKRLDSGLTFAEKNKQCTQAWNELDHLTVLKFEKRSVDQINKFEKLLEENGLEPSDVGVNDNRMKRFIKMKTKRHNDPNMPKKPVNGYFIYSREKRGEIIEKHPNMKYTEINRIISDMWNKMDEDDPVKKRFKQEAMEKHEKWKKDKEEYIHSSMHKKWMETNPFRVKR